MKLGWFDTANINNVYCGNDGGSYIRLPLLRELNRRGCLINYQSYSPGNYLYNDNPLDDLSIADESHRYRDELTFVRHRNVNLVQDIEQYDAVVVEARSSEFDEYATQITIVQAAKAENVPVLLLDRNNWARDMPNELRKCTWLLRPYPMNNDAFKKQEYFPYWYDTQIPDCSIEPEYDLVYVGNRWGRAEQMNEFLTDVEDAGYSMLVAGNWTEREPEMTEQFDFVEWVGSTPHYSTIPLLSLGKATFHVGKPDYNRLGFVTMRAAEARMARRPCYYSSDVKHPDIHADVTFDSPRDIDLTNQPKQFTVQKTAKLVRPCADAASQLIELVQTI